MNNLDVDKQLIGYLDPWSVQAGDTLNVHVSAELGGTYQAELVQLICGDSRPQGTGFAEIAVSSSFAGAYAGKHQPLHPGSYAQLPGLPELSEFTFSVQAFPTTPHKDAQLVSVHGLELALQAGALVVRLDAVEILRTPNLLSASRWHELALSYDAQHRSLSLLCTCLGEGSAERASNTQHCAVELDELSPLAAGDWLLAPGFNGRLEAPRLFAQANLTNWDLLYAADLSAVANLADAGLVAAWDFSKAVASATLLDVSAGERHGQLYQTPTRAVCGRFWDGSVHNMAQAPEQYAAIHFHADDLTDAQWAVDFQWVIPNSLPSGIYAVKLTQGDDVDHIPFFVRPGPDHQRAPVALLMSTATYLAYANQRVSFESALFDSRKPKNPADRYLYDHREVGYSLYEHHDDGSGVHFSSARRPTLNIRPNTTMWAFNADTNLSAWLTAIDQPFDVITDHDIHVQGLSLLNHYQTVITGTHPEYYSTPMLDALEDYLDTGGRLMYMGGNGFYWRVAFDPTTTDIMEVRRAEDGTRAWIAEPGEYCHAFTGEYGGLWRRLGRPPNQLVGVGFTAQGFDGGSHYRWRAAAEDARAAFMVQGVNTRGRFGDYGTQGGGAAGEELDRFDLGLGSPDHALVLASSEDHRPGMLRVKEEFRMMRPHGNDAKVRADLTFFETPAGGAVFSTGSISYAGALSVDGYDNDVAKVTENVLRRFMDPTPFAYPGAG